MAAMPSQKEEVEKAPRLPMPSRNPLPLSAAQEAQVQEVYHTRVRSYCAAEIKTFAECALGRTFTAPFKCREQNRAMNNCMITHATQSEKDAAREEWFSLRLQRQKDREAKEARRKEQEKFHREWWGLPAEDREGDKDSDKFVAQFPPKPRKIGVPTPTSTTSTVSATTPKRSLVGASASKPFMEALAFSEEPPLRVPETIGTLIEVRASPKGGLGIFALCPIPPNTLLLSEKPLVILTDTGTRKDPLDALVDALSPSHKAAFLSLHAYQANPRESKNRSILYSNGFGVGKVESLSTGVFETASRFNHACVANSGYRWEEDLDKKGRMKYFSIRYIELGEEVTVDYGHGAKGLKRFYGFECDCKKCREGEM